MPYRNAVAAVMQDRAGRILICERSDVAGAWQFPQGGIEPGETAEEALAREVQEEISLPPPAYVILEKRGPYRYRFPLGFTRKNYAGQSHYYFLLRLRVPKHLVKVGTRKAEFRSTRWIPPHDFDPAWLPPMKRRVYGRVFRDFFGVTIPVDDGHSTRHEPC